MSISDKLTQEKLLEILLDLYHKGHEKEGIQLTDFLKEIREQMLSVVNKK